MIVIMMIMKMMIMITMILGALAAKWELTQMILLSSATAFSTRFHCFDEEYFDNDKDYDSAQLINILFHKEENYQFKRSVAMMIISLTHCDDDDPCQACLKCTECKRGADADTPMMLGPKVITQTMMIIMVML